MTVLPTFPYRATDSEDELSSVTKAWHTIPCGYAGAALHLRDTVIQRSQGEAGAVIARLDRSCLPKSMKLHCNAI